MLFKLRAGERKYFVDCEETTLQRMSRNYCRQQLKAGVPFHQITFTWTRVSKTRIGTVRAQLGLNSARTEEAN